MKTLKDLKESIRKPHPRDALDRMAQQGQQRLGETITVGRAIWDLPKEDRNPEIPEPPK